jgi:membrane-associated phospholipid phosphatase
VAIVSWSELRISSIFTDSFASLQKDFTYIFAGWEKDIIINFQYIKGLPLTFFFGYIYIIVWPSLVVSSLIVYTYYKDLKTIKFLARGYLFSYLSVMPFYFLFPIKETWASEIGMQFMLNDITPKLEQCLRPLSGIDNCFPSFHVLLSFTVSFTALIKGYYKLGIILTILSLLISLSTLYLGIHWISDVIAGVIFASAVSLLISFTERGRLKIIFQKHRRILNVN